MELQTNSTSVLRFNHSQTRSTLTDEALLHEILPRRIDELDRLERTISRIEPCVAQVLLLVGGTSSSEPANAEGSAQSLEQWKLASSSLRGSS